MKKILGLLLVCMLILSMTAALAAPFDKITFNLQGYAVGLNAEDTRLKWNGEGVSEFVYIDSSVTEPEVGKGYFGLAEVKDVIVIDDDEGRMPAMGPLKADVPYLLEILIPLEEVDEKLIGISLPQEFFDIVNAYKMKEGRITTLYPVGGDESEKISAAIFTFQLKPAPKTLPATGDGAELMMWSAMVAFAAVSLVALNKKRVFGR